MSKKSKDIRTEDGEVEVEGGDGVKVVTQSEDQTAGAPAADERERDGGHGRKAFEEGAGGEEEEREGEKEERGELVEDGKEAQEGEEERAGQENERTVEDRLGDGVDRPTGEAPSASGEPDGGLPIKESSGEKPSAAGAEGDDGEASGAEETGGTRKKKPGIIATLKEELATITGQRDKLLGDVKKLKDKVLRSAADMDNLRKRTRREIEESSTKGRVAVLSELLPVVDNMERALDHASSDGSVESMVKGVVMVLRQFATAMEKFGVESFSAEGEAFDPTYHEAVGQKETDEVPPNTVVEEWQKGYQIDGRLLRPAVVVVSKKAASPPPEKEEADKEPPRGRAGDEAEEAAGDERDAAGSDAGQISGEEEEAAAPKGGGERASEEKLSEQVEE